MEKLKSIDRATVFEVTKYNRDVDTKIRLSALSLSDDDVTVAVVEELLKATRYSMGNSKNKNRDKWLYRAFLACNECVMNLKNRKTLNGQVQDSLAFALGVSTGTVAKMQIINNSDSADGSNAEIKKALLNGNITLNKAYQEVSKVGKV
jgi:hypothetical protein